MFRRLGKTRMMNENIYRIVMVDDDPEDIFTVKRCVKNSDLSCYFKGLNGGDELFALLSDAAEPLPDVIFLDINMPRMNGHAVLSKLRENPLWRDLMVIMLTTSDTEFDQVKAIKAGASGYVTKCSSMDETLNWISWVKSRLEDSVRGISGAV